ncbi:flavin reductase family protein [Aquibium microcysteis]|uniref:flavin reductase family protein n=1 Tax=Aquibium microcysteis TaxID=675281 RepID=UPI00165D137B|nr:flavin reductase family protein [Aquibium microcysteis]
MFYQPEKNDHGLPFNPFKSLVVPRPIAWISTVSADGIVNLAPFSQSNILGWDPPYVMFSAQNRASGTRPDSVTNAETTGEFVFNMATYDQREAIVETSMIMDPAVDELAATGLTPVESRLVRPPRVKESPVSLECRHYQTLVLANRIPGLFNSVVIGQVVGIHIDDDYITPEGRFDVLKARPLARMGYLDYTSVTDVFEIRPQGISEDTIIGMAGGGTQRAG